jgi:hypothetical protein
MSLLAVFLAIFFSLCATLIVQCLIVEIMETRMMRLQEEIDRIKWQLNNKEGEL